MIKRQKLKHLKMPTHPKTRRTEAPAESAEAEPAEEDQPAPLVADGSCATPYATDLGQQTGHTGDGLVAGNAADVVAVAQSRFFDSISRGYHGLCGYDRLDFDTVLYVRQNTCANQRAEVACNDDSDGLQSRLSFRAEANTRLLRRSRWLQCLRRVHVEPQGGPQLKQPLERPRSGAPSRRGQKSTIRPLQGQTRFAISRPSTE